MILMGFAFGIIFPLGMVLGVCASISSARGPLRELSCGSCSCILSIYRELLRHIDLFVRSCVRDGMSRFRLSERSSLSLRFSLVTATRVASLKRTCTPHSQTRLCSCLWFKLSSEHTSSFICPKESMGSSVGTSLLLTGYSAKLCQ